MTRTAHRIGLAAALVVALAACVGAGPTAAYAANGTPAVTSSVSLSFSGGTSITVCEQASLIGSVTFSDNSSANGLTVHVTRTNPDSTQTVVGDATTTSDQGGFNVVDTPPAHGHYTYTATFDGDAQRSGSTGGSGVLTVHRIATTLGLKSSTAKSGYRRPVTLTAHLGPHGADAVVAFYRTPAGGTRTLIRSVAAGVDGNAAITIRPRKNAAFDAAYAGDDVYGAAASPKITVAVRVRIAGTLSGFYGRSGAFRLYHYSTSCATRGVGCPPYTVSVAPGHAGDRVRLTLEFRSRSGWVVVGHLKVKLNRHSRKRIVLGYGDRTIIGQQYRLQAQFAADRANAGNKTAWSYLKVTA
jgi:hypothetical protein